MDPQATDPQATDPRDTDRYEPYFSDDTDGVHFQVLVDEGYVQAHVGRALLEQRFGEARGGTRGESGVAERCMAAYAQHRAELDAAVERRARREGPDTVVLRSIDLA